MTLATVGSDGRPSTRIVLVKGYDERGLVWYHQLRQPKGSRARANPAAALQFHWVELERVVRIEGTVEKAGEAESDAYFASRPLDSRIGAWASPQSQVIASRAVLVANAARYGARFMLKPPRPPHWGGFRLRPQGWEFWQGSKVAPARPAALSARGRHLGPRAPRTLSGGRAALLRARSSSPGLRKLVTLCNERHGAPRWAQSRAAAVL